MIRSITVWCVASLSAMTLLLGGCSSSPDMPPQTVSQLTSLRAKLADAKTQFQATNNAARDLSDASSPNVQPQIDRFNRELTALNNLVAPMRTQYQEAQAQAATYFDNWDKELNSMSQSVAEPGHARRAETQADFDQLKSQVAQLRAAYQPYSTAMEDARRYLATDPTLSGVRAMQPTLRQAIDRQSTILNQLDSLMSQMDDMRGA